MGGTGRDAAGGHDPAALPRHPELLQNHAETLAELELEGRVARGFCGASCSTARRSASRPAARARGPPGRGPGLQEASARADRPCPTRATAGCLIRMRTALRLEDALRQAITLHRRARTLHSELRAAERALAEEDNEANLAWLREVQSQLSSVEGAEADLDNAGCPPRPLIRLGVGARQGGRCSGGYS